MKPVLIKIFVVCFIAAVCGGAVGVLSSLHFYGFIPRPWLAKVYLSDTAADAKLRFWIAFAAGAIFGAVWSYRIVKDLEL
ncbi:MAG: hypothetical protein JSW27_20795 [Phycisphaerales bacterium]|nr:MAG: hypothetical protein JSW27_20795 [Phycisphaerales bacterium]